MSRKVDASRKLQKRAEQMIPGGVNSPVRAFRSVGCDPPFIVRGQGSHLWDVDENRYIDYVGSWGPLILGHAPPGSAGSDRCGGKKWNQLWSIDRRRS